MPTLLDIIKQNMESAGSAPTATGQTAKASKLAAARSGKAVGTAPVVDTSAEKMANMETQQKLGDIQQAGQMSAAALTGAQQKQAVEEKNVLADVEQRRQAIVQGNSIRKKQLIESMGRDKAELRLSDDKSRQEQLAQLMRLEDKKYLDTLELQGAKQRLDNAASFREAMEVASFGDSLETLRQALGYDSILAASDRQFKDSLASIDINAAIAMAEQNAAATKQMNTLKSAGELTKAGTAGYGDYKSGEYDSDYQDYKEDTGYQGSYGSYRKKQGGGE